MNVSRSEKPDAPHRSGAIPDRHEQLPKRSSEEPQDDQPQWSLRRTFGFVLVLSLAWWLLVAALIVRLL